MALRAQPWYCCLGATVSAYEQQRWCLPSSGPLSLGSLLTNCFVFTTFAKFMPLEEGCPHPKLHGLCARTRRAWVNGEIWALRVP